MTGDVPLFQRALGAAVVTGAALASFGVSMGRPVVREGLRNAGSPGGAARSSLRAAREVGRVARESAAPMVGDALDAKNRLRRRAVAVLPPGLGSAVEAWRLDFIEAEKAVYYGGKQAVRDLEPRLDRACDRGVEYAERVLDVFDDVVDASIAAAATIGEGMQRPAPRTASRRAPAKRSRR